MFCNKEIISLALALVLALIASIADADYTFGTPLNLGPTVNSSAHDDTPSVSADGLELYFMSYRLRGDPDGDLYVSTRITTQDPWGVPVNLGPTVNTSGYDITPCISSDGLELYFMSDRPGTSGGGYLWMTKRVTRNDNWGPPVNLPRFFSGGTYENSPAISSDGLDLYLRDGGHDNSDLWMISRSSVSGPWGQLMNLGPTVNSPVYDSDPSISSDGRMLFFASERWGGGVGGKDIWVARRATPDDDWGAPVNLGPDVSTPGNERGPSISADGFTLYFQSGRGGGYGGQDIWQVSIDPVVDLNGDGAVDAADMCIIVDYWGTDEPLCDIGPMPWGDGVVDVQDLIILAEHLFEGLGDNVIERRVSAGSDDAEEALNPGYWTFNSSSDLELVHDRIDNSGAQLVGMTFRDIDIAPGEMIGKAYIEFVCDEIINGTVDAYFLIWGHLTENSEGFVEPFVISNRPKTDAKAPWKPDPWDAGGQKIQTIDISPIIQELINQEGWIAGNAVEIIIGPDPVKLPFEGVRCAQSYDRSASAAPLLHIEVGAPSPVAHWKMDETEGGVAHDSAGDFDGTLLNGPVWQPTGGKVAGALQFDGIDDHVNAGFVLNPGNGPFSARAWVKGVQPGGVIISQTDVAGFGATWLGTNPSDGTLITNLMFFEMKSESLITDDTWHDVAIVWDGSRRYLYVDGQEAAKDTSDVFGIPSDGDLHVGAGKDLATGSFWSGLIDDVRIYDWAVKP